MKSEAISDHPYAGEHMEKNIKEMLNLHIEQLEM